MNFSQLFFQLLLFGFHEVTKRTSAKSCASMFTPLHIYVPCECVGACLCASVQLFMHANISVRACGGGGGSCMCVNTVCT